ncbi:MAG: dicarboxylate/amino acid:cation symporter [Ignavibacteriaceae bacterium]|nr:dicarboxylate/amino acid:cation symporter [Ignavibacteriaceae bacterium]
MKFKLPALHHQILIGLVLGAIAGSIFAVKENTLEIIFEKEGKSNTAVISDWKNFSVISEPEKVEVFQSNEQQKIIAVTNKLLKSKTSFEIKISEYFDDNQTAVKDAVFKSVTVVKKEKTVISSIKWIGDIFIRLLNLVAIPLVLSSLVVGAASLGDIRKFARIGSKTIVYYVLTTAVAVTIGILLADIIQPGHRIDPETKEKLLSSYSEDIQSRFSSNVEFDIINVIVEMVPKNPFAALSGSEMLQIVFFAVFLGMIITLVPKEKSAPVLAFFDGLSDIMIKMVEVIMIIAPLGVFALIASTVSDFGFSILQTLIWYIITVLLGLSIQVFGTYALVIRFLTKIKVIQFFRAIREAHTISFSTSSSAATLPVTMECCQKNLGISKSITSFVLPLGATINMDGTALYQGVATLFIAQVFGLDLNMGQQLTVIFMATVASIGTAPVPGVGIIMLIIILKSVGIPETGIALILGVDRIIDMCRTVSNITGDAVAAAFIATTENEIHEENIETVNSK